MAKLLSPRARVCSQAAPLAALWVSNDGGTPLSPIDTDPAVCDLALVARQTAFSWLVVTAILLDGGGTPSHRGLLGGGSRARAMGGSRAQ